MKYFENVKSYIEFYAPLIPYINCDVLISIYLVVEL